MIILTGGAGFIGSCVLDALNRAGHADVLIVDSLGNGEKWRNLVGRSYLDLVSKQDFREIMASGEQLDLGSVDTVIHLGACSATTERDADYLYDNNFQFSCDVAEFAADHQARFVYASSAATYGDGCRGYSEAEHNLRPLNMYGYSKHLFDRWMADQGLLGSAVGLKLFNVFGPHEYHKGEQASMVYKAYHQMMSSGTVRLFASSHPDYTDGGQLRDFIYVKDVVRVIMQLVHRTDINGLFNLGTGTARSWNDLATAVCSALGKPPSISYIPMPEHLAGQYQNYTQADMTLLRNELPDLELTPLEDTVSDYVNGYLHTSWPYLETTS